MNVTAGSYPMPVDEQGSNMTVDSYPIMPVIKQGMNTTVYMISKNKPVDIQTIFLLA